ncbi:MAG: hypothetical protein IJV50_00535 [Lachnospiraceae bacterium]|nr:hypothetical protein [Lachnospiraceae bacterium]
MRKLIGYELKKILFHPWVPLLFVFLLIVIVWSDIQVYRFSPDYARAGKELYEQYGGTVTKEHYEAIQAIQQGEETVSFSYFWKSDMLTNIRSLVSFSSMRSGIAKTALENVVWYQQHEMEYEARLNQKIAEAYQPEIRVQLVSSEDWKTYFTDNQFTMAALLLITILVCTIFPSERESGCDQVLAASATGRKGLFWAKYSAAMLISVSVMFCSVCVNWFVKRMCLPLTHLEVSVQSISYFARCPYSLKIWQAVGIQWMLQCVLALVYGIMMVALSSFFSKNLSGILSGGSWYLIGFLWWAFPIYHSGLMGINLENRQVVLWIEKLRAFCFPVLSDPEGYLIKLQCLNVAGYPVSTLHCCLFVTGIIVVVGTVVAYKYYTEAG